MMERSNQSRPAGAGKSSFELIDVEKVFGELHLKKGNSFLDLACGKGAYSIAASKRVGKNGRVFAVDLWEEGIRFLDGQLSTKGIRNVQAIRSDVRDLQAIGDHTIDVCLIATVLHDLVHTNVDDGALQEVQRVLKPKGVLAIIEFKKIEGPPGPPVKIRLSPKEVKKLVTPYGFKKEKVLDVGPYNYLLLFSVPQNP